MTKEQAGEGAASPPEDAAGGDEPREEPPGGQPTGRARDGDVGPLTALEGFEFVIERDGTVTFVDFPPELVDIAYALNPDDPLVCERRALLRGDVASDAPEDG